MSGDTAEVPKPGGRARNVVRLPVFIQEEREVGLGEVIKRVTSLVGARPCGECVRRAEALNRWVSFRSR